MTTPNDFQLNADDVIAELISIPEGKTLWEIAQLRVLAMNQNKEVLALRSRVEEMERQQAEEKNPDA